MLRVRNLESSIAFYTELLGMKLLRKKEYPKGRFTLAFVGFQSKSAQAEIELTYNWDTTEYELGTGFGHIAIEVEDVYLACNAIKKKGGDVVREAGPMQESGRVLAFVKDPDGYMIELLGVNR
jgi:lactoylglutathione lyase